MHFSVGKQSQLVAMHNLLDNSSLYIEKGHQKS